MMAHVTMFGIQNVGWLQLLHGALTRYVLSLKVGMSYIFETPTMSSLGILRHPFDIPSSDLCVARVDICCELVAVGSMVWSADFFGCMMKDWEMMVLSGPKSPAQHY